MCFQILVQASQAALEGLDNRCNDGSGYRATELPCRRKYSPPTLLDNNFHPAALQPPLAHSPALHTKGAPPDHGDCCICHELRRYSTPSGLLGWSPPPQEPSRRQMQT